jgi:hypothetical protein
MPLPQSPLPVLSIDDIAGIAAFIIRHCGLQPRSSSRQSAIGAKLTADG